MNKQLLIDLLLTIAVTLAGCAAQPAPLFAPQSSQLVWPASPRPARIVYVGELSNAADLKPNRGVLDGIGQGLVGPSSVSGMLTPYAICTDGADRLFVTDTGSQRIHVFNLRTRQYQQWKPAGKYQLTQPVGIAWDPRGRLIVSDSVEGCLFVFDSSGKLQDVMGKDVLKKPAGIVIDRISCRIFICDLAMHQIVVLAPDGKLISRLGQRGVGPGELNFPTNLAIDSKGNLYVTDALNFRIQMFDPDLHFIQSFGQAGNLPGYFGQPKGIALDSEDHLYVVDNRQEIVQLFDSEARLLLFFGGEGNKPGQFWLPAGICIDSHNRMWIADSYNKRVAVFDYLPEKHR